MFSIRELDRYRRWPLAWVFGPLILGGLLVTIVAFALHAAQGFPDRDLAQRIEHAALEDRGILLGNLTGFAWDSVCVFPPSATPEVVDQTIGVAWSRAGGSLSDAQVLLVFVRDEAVVTHAYVDRGVLDAPAGRGECREPDDPGTELRVPVISG